MLKSIFSIIFVFCISSSFAQLTLQQKLQSNLTIETQFQTLLLQSRNQDADFKVIRKSNLEIIQKNIKDSIGRYKKEIADLKNNSSSSVATAANLKDSLKTVQTDLNTERAKTDSISFLGIDFSKPVYHTIVWTAIGVLAIALFTFIVSFRKAKVDAVEFQKTAEEAQNDFQVYKKKTMETEQKLRRQLLDEQLKRNS